MGGKLAVAVAAWVCLSFGVAGGGIIVHFDQDTYTTTPGGSFDVQILLDMDDATPGDQVPAAGLFSVGVKVTFDPAKAEVSDTGAISLPAVWTDGLGGAPYKSVGAGYGGFAGALDLVAIEGYKQALLGTVTVTDLAPETYALGLGLYYPGAQTNFMDFDGTELDDDIGGFGSAQVTVIPEPVALASLCLGGLALAWRRRRRG